MAEVTIKTKWVLWTAWLIIFPTGLYYSYQFDPPAVSSVWIPVCFILLGIIIICLPFEVDNSSIFIIHWVNLAAFLSFGLFFEMVLMQIFLIPLLIRLDITRKTLYRYALYSSVFLISSVCAAAIYYSFNFSVTEDSLLTVTVGGSLYLLILVALNHIYLYGFNRLMNNEYPFFSNDALLDRIITLLSMPYGLALYFLLDQIGIAAVIYLGLPYIALAAVLKLYNSSKQLKNDLVRAGEIGHQLAAKLKIEEVLDLFINKLSVLMPVDCAYILDTEINEDYLILLRRIENGELKSNNLTPVRKGEGITGKVWRTGESVLFNSKIEWTEEAEGYMPDGAESLLSVPIKRDKKMVAVLLVASGKKHAYRSHIVQIVELLSSYFAVAIENARNHQRAIVKSERCGLTGLYNYRYFDEQLHIEFDRMMNGHLRQLSLILIDIDHFKQVNDTFGHQSGNDLLQSMAGLLVDIAGDKGVLARYGGEEFVLMMGNTSKEEALTVAEIIRTKVEDTSFKTHYGLNHNARDIEIDMTVSIGVSSAPEDTDSAINLLRNADRALFTGAKQKGRNRVAEFSN
ncbi:GGDEF domain-containing protein [Jeotgalibacillus sp. S-D1]|uniref:sensor domain-containing diguanylate cyclase n=1 Tax=Jeotgalibacillus sp. S-D1 TaxID=2552189 RepID=UPI001059B150|nr:sensor domain-containing diguanylate cyclase [Jeotgalibacillus sp. S-D1]TDL34405.1 GGDEF domain-containing protein [Jeotgalibacillus sp. S-D1]